METDARWHHGRTLAAGQVAEFKVWAELVRQSMGGLHVFLPLRDMGIDGVVHRLADGAYTPVQVKGRTELTPTGQVHVTVTASSLHDDEALVVCVLIEEERLGHMVLVATEARFRELAAHDVVDGREYLTAAFELHAGGTSRWAPFLVERERLAERFGSAAGLLPGRADANVLAFPDLETVEVLARAVDTRGFLGLQVKTAGWDRDHLEERIYMRRSSFRPFLTTYVCVLGWDRVTGRFGDECLLIPSEDMAGLARVEKEWLVLELQPGSAHHRRLDVYRIELSSLGQAVEALLASQR